MAGVGDEWVHAHLTKHGLNVQKWEVPFLMEINDPDNIEDKEAKFAKLSRHATASEKVALSKALGISDCLSASEGVDGILKEANLDVKYWAKVLSKQVGAVTVNGLHNLSSLFYPHLVKFARSQEEQRALQIILSMKADETTLSVHYDKYVSGLKEQATQLLHTLNKVQDAQSNGEKFEDETVQTLCQHLQEHLQIPKEFWFSNETFDTVIKSFEVYQEVMQKIVKTETIIDDCTVVQMASNGLVSKGILKQSNNGIHMTSNVIDVPEGVVLQLPIHSLCVKNIHYIGKEDEDAVQKGIIMPKGPIDSFSTKKVLVVPVASCSFRPTQLKLTIEAIERLKEIERSNGKENCKDFIKEFGSHVCLGPFHFGGTYKWHCCSYDIKQEEVYTAKDLQTEVIKVYACMSNPPEYPEEIDTSIQCSRDLHQKTYLDITTSGGDKPPVSVALWKIRLMVDRKSWVVLDSGTNHYPVWEIISRSHDFENPLFLAGKVKEAWKELNSFCNGDLYSLDNDAEEVSKKVGAWIEKISYCNSIEHISDLLKERERVTKENMDIQVWSRSYLCLGPVQRYFELIVDMCRKQHSTECENIKNLLRQVVGPADLESVQNFPNRDVIRKWMFETHRAHALIEYRDLMSDIGYCFRFAFEIIDCNQENDEAVLDSLSDPDINIKKANTVVRNTIYYIKKHLQRTGQLYDNLYVTTLLIPFQYTVQNMLYLRGPFDVKILHNLFQKYTQRFFDVKMQNSSLKLQAFIVMLAIEISKDVDMCASSKLCAHLMEMSELLGKQFESAIRNVVHNIIKCDANNLEWEYETLKRIMEATDEDDMVEEIKLAMVNAAEPVNPAKNFELMLTVFDFKKYYPQKFTLLKALEVRENDIGESQICYERKSYALLIMKKILSFDYNCFVELADSAISDMEWMSQQFKKAEFVIYKEDQLSLSINPLDGLITVLLCADNFLRQDLMCRLATCQIAIPLVLPDPMTGNLTLTLWSTRTIVKEWELQSLTDKKELSGYEARIISQPTPIVSFLRFGIHKHSKSKLMNMAIDSGIDTFFHYDCKGGRATKLIAGGMIDTAWHLPSKNSSFSNVVTFLNLHGDARDFKTQVQFLSDVCFMHFVLLNVKQLDESGYEVLKVLSKAPGGVILLQSGRVSRAVQHIKREQIKIVDVIELDKRNDAEKKSDIQHKINNGMAQGWDKTTQMEKYWSAALHCGIVVDEDIGECAEGKLLLNDFKQVLDKSVSPKSHLQLQGVHYWHEIAQKEKEKFRPVKALTVPIEKYTEKMDADIQQLYKKQNHCVTRMRDNPLVNTFITTLCKLSKKKLVRNYYLRWLKLLLDDLSRESLPSLHREYHKKRTELQDKRRKGTVDDKCKKDMEELNMKLIGASFGLEHLLREIGQIYQASTFFNSSQYKHLPEIVAELLIDGYPLELMDGDTAHVPEKWVITVLERVKAKLNDPHILAISIVGVQSSGKSTLLNTLFGVNFSVSAGRCTRGAFIQLLPIHKSFKKNSYLLLVDTEGLRAPELDATQTHNHDNQLGTFVVGLAHLTLINIRGEVLADMKDILQTAVHAFLRMKYVTTLSPSCHFVHHNVNAVMANNKGLIGRGKIIANLDEMTKIAAKEEGLKKNIPALMTSYNSMMKQMFHTFQIFGMEIHQ